MSDTTLSAWEPSLATAWNANKPHRCPECHAVAIDMERPKSWRVYACCRCGTRFTRWPRLARLLPKAGSRCFEHCSVATDEEPTR